MNGICCLCQLEHETRDHMFYGCSYSRSIWRMILTLCGQNRMIGGWSEELQWAIKNIKGRTLVYTILRVAWKAFIYHVWKERNRRLFGNSIESSIQVMERIKDAVRLRFAGLRKMTETTINKQLCTKWGCMIFVRYSFHSFIV